MSGKVAKRKMGKRSKNAKTVSKKAKKARRPKESKKKATKKSSEKRTAGRNSLKSSGPKAWAPDPTSEVNKVIEEVNQLVPDVIYVNVEKRSNAVTNEAIKRYIGQGYLVYDKDCEGLIRHRGRYLMVELNSDLADNPLDEHAIVTDIMGHVTEHQLHSLVFSQFFARKVWSTLDELSLDSYLGSINDGAVELHVNQKTVHFACSTYKLGEVETVAVELLKRLGYSVQLGKNEEGYSD